MSIEYLWPSTRSPSDVKEASWSRLESLVSEDDNIRTALKKASDHSPNALNSFGRAFEYNIYAPDPCSLVRGQEMTHRVGTIGRL